MDTDRTPPRSSPTTRRRTPLDDAARLHPSAPWRAALRPAIALLALFAHACIPSEEGNLQPGDPAPDLTTASLADRSPIALTDYNGNVLLVNLWATWCHPCRTETPYIQSLYERYHDQGLRVLGISVDMAADSVIVAEFIHEMGVKYDIALDPDGWSEDAFRARGLPTSVVLDRDSRIAFSWIGPIPEDDPTFEEGLERVLMR